MDLGKLDEDQEIRCTEYDYNERFYGVELFIPHAGTFTGYGLSEDEAERAAWLLAKAYLEHAAGPEARS